MNQLPKIPDTTYFTHLAEHFFDKPVLQDIKILPGGHIHRTHAVYLEEHGITKSYIFQRINTHVFPNPHLIMNNIQKITEHLLTASSQKYTSYQMNILAPVLSKDAKLGIWFEGYFWRVFPFFENSLCTDQVDHQDIAFSAGRAFGHFFHFLSDMDASQLSETLPGFHSGTLRIQQFREACEKDPAGRKKEVISFLEDIEPHIPVLTRFDEMKESMPLRVTHHDAKLNNVLLNEDDFSPVAVIDLDTVMGGSILSDFGDLVRSLTCVLAEDDEAGKAIIQMPFFEALLQGFLGECGSILEKTERQNLVFGAEAITFMVTLRFITDYLNGDTYFQTSYPNHNFIRARNQFTLFLALKEKAGEMNKLVEDFFL